jgi:hypothetical protein
MLLRNKLTVSICLTAVLMAGCQNSPLQGGPGIVPSTLRDVPALRLNYRYEADAPDPAGETKKVAEERNAAVQNDFDQNRPQEQLYTTIASPDKNRVLVVYTRVGDIQSEYRLDMYTPAGVLMRKMTPETMAVHFPDTIQWAPDASVVAFVAMVRAGQEEPGSLIPGGPEKPGGANSNTKVSSNSNTSSNSNSDPESNTGVEPVATPVAPVPAPPMNVLTFRTEQIYICNAEGDGIKALTQNEGLIYFYYVWAPDSSALAALAVTFREWQYLQYMADSAGEQFVPSGRPRLVEKNGRERRLDDALTKVHPVWSPDSAKVAEAFDPRAPQVRIYDAIGNAPTQAAIPLRNQLLLSSQAYDQEQQRKEMAGNTAANTAQPATVLPDEKTLVSFNPIVEMSWTSPDLLYFETGYVKLLKKEGDSVRSYLRWHRLVLSPQPITLAPVQPAAK